MISLRELKKTIEPRMGGRTLRQRLFMEEKRRRDWYRSGVNFSGNSLLWTSMAVNCFFKLTGLYHYAKRQFKALEITQREESIKGLPLSFEGFKILHLSDLHLDLDNEFPEILCKILDSVFADICVITGDFRNFTVGDSAPGLARFREVMTHLKMPVYGVLGNHDSITSTGDLEKAGIRMLLNEHVILKSGNDSICLAGVDDPNVYKTDRLDRALRGVPKNIPVILLAHSPAIYKKAAAAGVAFMMSGHLHGGQICLPGGFMIFGHDQSPRRIWRGHWTEDAMHGYTSRGTGACGVPLRMFSPPEIVLHKLVSTSGIE